MLSGLGPEPGLEPDPESEPPPYPTVPVSDPDPLPVSDPPPVPGLDSEPEAVVLLCEGSAGTKRWSRLRLVLARVSDAWMFSPDWMIRVELEAPELQVTAVVVNVLHWLA